ncbi:MAG TPA: SbcC/MukB-like Walker B domain-containing protein, partial [Angustibacter sp.]|nr:SbcC/MukB-like Walker B domain-containing protein [Angustibacter sp.]
RRADLLATLAQLDADGDEHRAAVGRLDTARRAQRLAVILPRLADATAAEAAATERVGRQRSALPDALAGLVRDVGTQDPGNPSLEPLEVLLDERRRQLTRLDDARAQDDELHRLDDECSALREQVDHLEHTVTDLAEREPVRLAALTALRERQDALLARASTLQGAQQALAAARAVARAADELAECGRELAEHDERRRAAHDADLEAHARLLDVRERRLRGMAAALAAGLAAGRSCPVCGSTEHPDPAPTAPGHVDEAQERLAQEQADAARAAREDAQRAHAAVAQRHAALSAAAAGRSVEAARSAVADSERELAEAEQAAQALEQCRDELRTEQADHDADVEARQTAQRRRDETRARLEVQRARQGELGAALARLLGGADDLTARRDQVAAEADALDAVLDAERDLAVARTRADDLRAAAAVAAAELGFADVRAAQQAWLDDDAFAALEQAVRDHERLRADTEAVLATPELRDLDDAASPDLDALRSAAEQAEQRSGQALRATTIAQQAHGALTDLAEALREHDDVHRELRARHRHVDELSRCVDGTGGGNVRRMRLSAFVLAARLEEVAVAASERLVAMSDGRYTLAHSDDLAKGGARSGLGLEVVDSWTGVAREPSTLSGGESFIASLALALGLADVVQAEAGGTDIETLFVDEGFGSLDDDALEEVMTVLDGLRSGGRTVGIVSHVADLRSRIHQQLEVVKTRTGSTVRHRCGDVPAQVAS